MNKNNVKTKMAKLKTTTKNIKENIKYRSYIFALDIVKFVSDLPKTKIADILGAQLLRCGTSVGANIIEAQSGTSRKDFINFYSHALKSANESKFWLCLFRNSKIGNLEKCNQLLDESIQISNMLGKSILTLKGK
ncbi:MAG: four helix bundle protein [Candidatus Nealsonbacteria bacterium CG23_combo_of_CG06-09_8_20_14_all_40_13]|uniref:Four helix bundle protein n=1 Tax=Candidatus Nealsonbacteria bacterium CG23_combo_of_CG06-09_8_20_14_all_40_13 TaxID=1974724 RepID=A0A2G9YQB9_9BACT|nr:MAG: four helix bundle protein [Candidatus Nealsonbacteria bacterium CG23_combo_of_CG06-09_8_20_14_all_40_13]PIR71125.1 MAG: four helix bundle protein [Candidatus Nealsonbacteria bacterium CG10_big_fil_rev_8_21_14_0_10_40_24]PIU43345.1 MAG: four helix bundle protein [Candidatus Nealsonbacteria bacterium CG07_land_8_20_14_0_80_40_10]